MVHRLRPISRSLLFIRENKLVNESYALWVSVAEHCGGE